MLPENFYSLTFKPGYLSLKLECSPEQVWVLENAVLDLLDPYGLSPRFASRIKEATFEDNPLGQVHITELKSSTTFLSKFKRINKGLFPLKSSKKTLSFLMISGGIEAN